MNTKMIALAVAAFLLSGGSGVAGAQVSTRTVYSGYPAYRLTDGKTEAVVVPALGRVMRYGLVGGPNLLWNAPPQTVSHAPGQWANWGGDKLWVAPQSQWPALVGSGKDWPPDPAWDGLAQRAVLLPNGHLRLSGPVSTASGIGLSTEFWFAANGDFVLRRTMHKQHGPAVLASLWNVTQVTAPDSLFVPANAHSAYKNNFHYLMLPHGATDIQSVTPSLLEVTPTLNGNYKLGVDAPVAAVAAVWGSTAFVESANRPEGDYPDGAAGAGFPVEVYDSGGADGHYLEMEMLSPLRLLRTGGAWTDTVHWSLHTLPDSDRDNALQKLLSLP